MSSWEHVIDLDRILRTRKYPVPLNEILTKLECHRSAFFRAKQHIECYFGKEIAYSRKHNGYYYVNQSDQEEIPAMLLRHDEIEALVVFSNIIQNLQPGFLADMLDPLIQRFEPALKKANIRYERFVSSFKIISLKSRTVNPTVIEKITTALFKGKQLSIVYKALGTNLIETRAISPQTLLRYRDNWYVDAWCHLRNDLRTFALNRICNIEMLQKAAVKVRTEQLESHFGAAYGIFSGNASHLAVIRFTGLAAKEVLQEKWHPSQVIEKSNEDSIIIKIPYGTDKELIMDILQWADQAEVLEPIELRDKISTLAKKTFALYQKS